MNSNNNLPANSQSSGSISLSNAANILNIREVALKPTSYSSRVTSTNPCAFVLLIDQSSSMDDDVETNSGELLNKANYLSGIVNKFLEELILTCQKDRIIKDYFEILIIGYGRLNDDDESIVQISWEGNLKNKTWVSVNELRNNPIRREKISKPNPSKFGPRILNEEVNVWIDPHAEGRTPMKQAFETCEKHLRDWVINNPNSFPPMVFNITDGEANDIEEFEELVVASEKIKSISTNDGNALLFNMLLTDNSKSFTEFPTINERIRFEENEYELALFDASSIIPQSIKDKVSYLNKSEDTKALVFGTMFNVINFLNIGTSTLGKNI
jgi:hypothetical protein